MGRQRGVQYKGGSFLRLDDRTGFVRRAENTKSEWTGLIVGNDVWEIRQPQDFVRAVPDDQTVPDARPVPPNVFVGPFSTEIALDADVGATVIFLRGVEGMSLGDPVGVMLANGEYFRTNILGIDYVDVSITLVSPVPLPVAAGSLSLPNVVTDFIEPKIAVTHYLLNENGDIIRNENGDPIVVEG